MRADPPVKHDDPLMPHRFAFRDLKVRVSRPADTTCSWFPRTSKSPATRSGCWRKSRRKSRALIDEHTVAAHERGSCMQCAVPDKMPNHDRIAFFALLGCGLALKSASQPKATPTTDRPAQDLMPVQGAVKNPVKWRGSPMPAAAGTSRCTLKEHVWPSCIGRTLTHLSSYR